MAKVHMRKVYDKTSHCNNRSKYAPVISRGVVNEDEKSINFTVHMTPELRNHPTERRVLLAHEKREAVYLAQGKSVHYAHRQAASKEPEWLKGEQGLTNIWERLGKKPKV